MAARSKSSNTDIEIKKNGSTNDVIDIELKEIQKKRFRLDRDNSRVIELDTSDLTVIKRLEEIYPKMLSLVEEAQTSITENPDGTLDAVIEINNKMKDLLDYAFDSKIADKACPSGTLYDPINGKFRFEYIMEKLIGLYDENLSNEIQLMEKRVNKHTAKYTKKRATR